jgi:Ankyrin repeats (3 copies)
MSYGDRPQMNSIRLAALLGHEKVLELMLQLNKYCDINEFGSAGRSKFCHGKTVQMLLNRATPMPKKENMAMPCKLHQKVVTRRVTRSGGCQCPRVQSASAGGREKIVQMLLDRGADVNARGGLHGNALQAASHGGHEKIVQMLLDREADVDAHGNALQAALAGGHEKAVQMLLDRGADVNAQRYCNAPEMLLDRGADVNAQGGHDSALYAASKFGYEK